MISYLEGILLKRDGDKAVILTQGIGDEVLLPAIVSQTFTGRRAGEDVYRERLHTFLHHKEHQPQPVLVYTTTEVVI